MWGVGPATEARLAKIGVTTIGQLAESSPQSVERLLGHAVGRKLTALAWNRDPRQIQTRRRAHSAGAQSALGRRPAIERVFKPTLHHLADRIGGRLRAKSLAGRTVTVRVRFADLRSVTRSLTLSAPISATRTLADIAEDRAQTRLSMRFASASGDKRWIMGQRCGLSAPSPTSSGALLKENCEYRQPPIAVSGRRY
jgi:DNA polymerase-4